MGEMTDLSVLIPARNEMFLARTIQDVLENIEGDSEIIAVLDGGWADPPIADHPRVTLIHHAQSIGQRAAVNEAARVSTAKYIMKADAHCAFDKGFDVKLMADCEYDWTVISRMYNLHAFDWKCAACGHQTYQGSRPVKCASCESEAGFEMVVIWQPRLNRKTDFARFDSDLHFQYWRDYEKRPEAAGETKSPEGIVDVMCSVGACWFMHRQRFLDLGGLDEVHGSWGQVGVEISAKAQLSGGRHVVNRRVWFSHLFRTQPPDFGFPYPNPGIEQARAHSRHLWLGNNWPGAVHPFSWLLEKYWPVPDWTEEDLDRLKKSEGEKSFVSRASKPSRGVIYYTDNRLDSHIMSVAQSQLTRSVNGHQLISVSLKPLDFGENVTLEMERGILTMFKQILAGLEASTADIVFLAEHDVLYHPSHFDFIPPRRDVFYYNENVWKVDHQTGQALFYYCKQTSGLCAYRELLLEHYRKRVERVEREGFTRRMGFEPGTHSYPRGIDSYRAEAFMSAYPNIDIRHRHNLTASRWSQSEFRNQKYCQGWTLADEVGGWGITKGRFEEFLQGVM